MAMALAPRHLQSHKCFRAIHTSQPAAWEGMKKVATFCPTENKNRYSAFSNYPCLRVKKQCIRVLSFQYVSKKGDSNGGDDPEPQTQLPSSSAWQAMDEAEKSSQTLQGFPGWFTNVEKQNFILQANEILWKPIFKLKSLDRDCMIKHLQHQVSEYSLKLWQSLEVRTKFSLAITLLFFLAVTVQHGIQVSGELLPLWIIGPWVITNYIKLCMSLFWLCVRTAINIVQSSFVQRVVRGVAVNLMHTKDTLVRATNSLIQAPQLFRQTFETKRDYIMSGELKKFLLDKYEERQERIREMVRDAYLDYMEANWPNWRRTQRFLKKLFPK